jgi:phosphoribosylpyrophosphate synthetase
MIDTGGTLAKAADLMMEGSIEQEQFVHTPFYQETLTKNRKISITELIVTRFDSIKEKNLKNKS